MTDSKPKRGYVVSPMEAVADEEMVKNATGDEYDELAVPPNVELCNHQLTPLIVAALKEIFDPEIPVNIYDLGLVYTIAIDPENAVDVVMTLTAPGCPVAGEMPGWLADAIEPVAGVKQVNVEITWEPQWGMDMMSDEARLELGFM